MSESPAQQEQRARLQRGFEAGRARRAAVADKMAPRREACRPPVDCPACPALAGEFCQMADGTHYSQPGVQLYVHGARRALL